MPEEHEITDLRRRGRGERVEVFVDGERVWILTRKYLEKLGLAVGQRLSPDALATLHETVSLAECKSAALRALGRKARTETDLRQRLQSLGYPEAAIVQTLLWLTERGFINDEQYAQDRVTSLQRRRLGSRAIAQKLQQEGVARDLVRNVMSERAGELHETELARELAVQLNMRWQSLEGQRRRSRIYQHLARRGFASDAIMDALNQLGPEDDSSEVME